MATNFHSTAHRQSNDALPNSAAAADKAGGRAGQGGREGEVGAGAGSRGGGVQESVVSAMAATMEAEQARC